jgi:hypothetical protein
MKPTHAVNDNQIGWPRKVWQARIGRDLTEEDTRQITENITGFFSVLFEWSRAEMPRLATDPGKPTVSHEEVHRDR